MENTAEKITFAIPEYRFDEFKSRIEALNKKAAKVGVPAITFAILESYEVKYSEHPLTGELLLFPMVIKFHKISVDGMEPKFSGWSFLARIDHEENGVNIIAAMPGVELNERYRTLGPVCEHCRINRYRKQSYVVRHENGTEKQVGSTCLKDFLGHGTPERIAMFCESLFTFIRGCSDDDFMYGGAVEHRHDIEGLLALTVAVIRKYGWTSGTKARELGIRSTADDVREYIYGKGKAADEMRREIGEITADDKELAKLAIAWVKGFTGKLTDYQYNLQAVCSNGSVTDKHLGVAISAIASYQREIGEIMKRAAKAPSQWIGHPDAGRMKLENVKVLGMTPCDSFRGTSYLYRFMANGKDILTWFASSNQGLDAGDIVNMVFTVKELKEWRGEHQTAITRAKITVIGHEEK